MKSLLFFSLTSCFFVLSPAALALPTHLTGLPSDPALQGEAFFEAWQAFRQDVDTLAHSGAHPALLEKWFEAMPEFLVRDAAKLATDPQVVLAAATRMSKLGGNASRQIIADLVERHEMEDIKLQLKALAIVAGSPRARLATTKALKSDLPREQLIAAIVLMIAGNNRGRTFLRGLATRGAEGSETAFRALGRFGNRGDEAHLKRLLRENPENPILAAAGGELAMRRLFPHHHRALIRRTPGSTLFSGQMGLYETWLQAVGDAIEQGTRSSSKMVVSLENMRRLSNSDVDKEVWRRQLKTLVDFWGNVDKEIASTSVHPAWPSDFSQAMQAIETRAHRSDDPVAFAKRVAAEIAVCHSAGEALGYSRLAAAPHGVRALTPGGGRAVDENLATAWHAQKGDTLELKRNKKGNVAALWIMSACPLGKGGRLSSVEITGSGAGDTWTHTAGLDSGMKFFQKIPLGGRPAKKLAMQIREIRGTGPSCVSEVRVVFR
ncbi:MAG: hypothetical protein GY854_17035 [Deltaproteobacteria bacterium]|nr:hypothetical protein [Deltaproteobacteria bacterium]